MAIQLSSNRLVLATQNRDKLKEIQSILDGMQYELVSLLDFPNVEEVEETGDTLLENAMIKAQAAYDLTGLPSLADDTGLEVDALDGAPGVYSSRFAGEDATYADNVNLLLKRMKDVPQEKRRARFRCVSALVDGGNTFYTEGICEGEIITSCKGEKGFGYDPVFFVPALNKTFAEMSAQEKDKISHRGDAFCKMKLKLNGA